MEIKEKYIAELKPYEKNTKKHPKEQIKKIADSITEFGFKNPILIDKEGVIIAGHGRLLAAQLLKLEKVPTISIEDLTPEQLRAYRIADNKLAESGWDMGFLKEEMEALKDFGYDVFKTGFASEELSLMFDKKAEEDSFDVQNALLKPKYAVKVGQIWKLGNHRLICGDSTKKETFQALMNGKKANLIITDPPYNVGYDYTVTYVEGRARKNGWLQTFNDSRPDDEFTAFLYDVFKNLFEFTQDDSPFYCWHASKNELLFRQAIEGAGFYVAQTLYWLKNYATFGRGIDYLWITEPCYYGWKKGKTHYVNKKLNSGMQNAQMLGVSDFNELLNVIYSVRDKQADYKHPTQKPVILGERALKKSSKEGDIVLEPFGGSGSTMIACEQLNRCCYLSELTPEYCSVIIERYESFSKNKAELLTELDIKVIENDKKTN